MTVQHCTPRLLLVMTYGLGRLHLRSSLRTEALFFSCPVREQVGRAFGQRPIIRDWLRGSSTTLPLVLLIVVAPRRRP